MDTTTWSTEEVAEYLENLGLGSYQEVFIEHDINGEALPLLSEEHLKEIGMKSIGHRITLMQWLQKIKRNSTNSPISKSKRRPEFNANPSPGGDQDEEPQPSSKGWEQKRRAAMMRRLQNGSDSEQQTQGKRRIMQPEMNFGSAEDHSDGLFGAPPPIKGSKRQSNYGDDDDDDKPLKFNPNPFSREDDDNPPPIPRVKRQAATTMAAKKHVPAPNPPQKKKPSYKQPEPETDSESDPHQPYPSGPSSYQVDFDQYGEDDVPPMGGSKLGGGGGFPGNSRTHNKYDNDDDDDGYKPPARKTMTQRPKKSAPPPSAADDGPDDRVACSICGRKFAPDRIEAHERACQASASRKKKVFDSSKMRVQGTEAAQFQGMSHEEPKKKKVDFRKQHEQLVANMRAARQVQQYEDDRAKGKAVGPPPALPKYEMPDDDRVECPYCGRKFGAEAAERHIPFCERQNAGRMRGGKANQRKGRR